MPNQARDAVIEAIEETVAKYAGKLASAAVAKASESVNEAVQEVETALGPDFDRDVMHAALVACTLKLIARRCDGAADQWRSVYENARADFFHREGLDDPPPQEG